ncbi:portal protein [Arthrobacter phage Whytu]|uniref:Portal protein n=1 Tax=Arthrobacter phage Whytu TaxID=2713260 RepID=A0A6G8R2S2_9CAUD|nr:portal protein [Arthrobacter phage Whytu]QIN94471.1 portal protein [Arthrobacter phage Whytu]
MGLTDRISNILGFPSRPGLFDGVAVRSPESALLESVVFFGGGNVQMPVTSRTALKVPGIARAIQLYTAVCAQLPLKASVESEDAKWLNWSEGTISPALRNALTVQDIIFHGGSCYAVARNAAGHVTNGIRIPVGFWTVDPAGRIQVNTALTDPDAKEGPHRFVDVDQNQIMYIPSLMPCGLLDMADDGIQTYLQIGRTIKDRASNPTPLIALVVKDDAIADPDELKTAQTNWHNARTSPNGAVAIVPAGVGIETPGADRDDSAMLIGARNASRLDVANWLNLPAAMLDGNSGTSDQYSNTLQNQNEFLALSVSLPIRAIEARLSQDDVTPAGVTVSFDTAVFDSMPEPATGNTGAAVESSPAGAAVETEQERELTA